MANLGIGDRVKFLNASGGGVVTKVIDSRTVAVMTKDGFEIPTLTGELVKIEPDIPAARFFNEKYKIDPPAGNTGQGTSDEDRQQPLPVHGAAERKSEDLYLAYVPHDQKWLITGQVDVFLINNSSYDVLYSIFSKNPTGHYTGLDYGSIYPDSKVLIQTVNREQLAHWTDGYLQLLFHRDQCPIILPPVNSEFKVESRSFSKEGNYREHRLIRARGLLIKVISLGGLAE